mmetsp:Transcript_40906/g.98650  ORF Transcript_40906/g.98650 Transcript_40906/m.98650 type:complete len:643 (+) Transcript_40906:726-2654(+)
MLHSIMTEVQQSDFMDSSVKLKRTMTERIERIGKRLPSTTPRLVSDGSMNRAIPASILVIIMAGDVGFFLPKEEKIRMPFVTSFALLIYLLFFSCFEKIAYGFRDTIHVYGPDGDGDGKPDSEYPVGGNPFIDTIPNAMEHAVESGADAVVFLYGWPITHSNFTDVVAKYRHLDIKWLGVDGTVGNLEYMAQNYVDALIGEQTYQIGHKACQALYQMLTEGVDFVPDRVPTKLINYNLVPEELPELIVDQNLLGDMKWIGYICFGIVAVFFLVCMAWTVVYRKEIVVKASQPFFLAMTASGVLLMGSTLIPLSFDDGGEAISDSSATGICMSIPWLGFTGFSITFSAMFSKTYRVNQFFKSSNARARIRVKERDVLIPFLIMFCLNIIILICWTLIDPLKYVRSFSLGTDVWNREIASAGQCVSEDGAVPYLVPLALINLIVLAIACWQAYEARDIKSEFAEAKYIAMTVFSLTQGFLTGLPIVAVARENPTTFYLILTVLVFGVCMVVLSLIFVPKMLMQRRYGKMSGKEQRESMMVSVRLSARMAMDGPGAGAKAFSSRSAQTMPKIEEPKHQRVDDLHNENHSSDQTPSPEGALPKPNNQELGGSSVKNPESDGSSLVVMKVDGRRVVSSYLEDEVISA